LPINILNRAHFNLVAGIAHGEDVTADNVGLHVATTNTHASGFLYDSDAAFSGHAIAGNGTQGNPYIIDRRLYQQDVRIRDTPTLYVKFTNCKFQGNSGGNSTNQGTPAGSSFFWVESDGAFCTIEDSTGTTANGPSTDPDAPGGGCDKGFYFARGGFTLRRVDCSMANVPFAFNTERTDPDSLFEECYGHHIWSTSVSSDHTDVWNGNAHASNITMRRCKAWGIRTGNTYTTNGIGIYDDPADSGGIIENWTIDGCYIDHNATQVLSTGNTSRFLAPFVVTDNIMTDDWTVGGWIARTPTTQSNNRDQDDNPLTF
jgi:hypothetical protein